MVVTIRLAIRGSGCKYLSRKAGSNVLTAIVSTYIKFNQWQLHDVASLQYCLDMILAII
jgi:hypothetical protein